MRDIDTSRRLDAGKRFKVACAYTALVILAIGVPRGVCEPREGMSYSFFVAGHTYGKPGVNNVGVHPPFRENFDYIKGREGIQFGVFTGDIVKTSTDLDWDEVERDIALLGMPIYFAPGNHDGSTRKRYLDRYAVDGKTYYAFSFQGDLFVVLNPNIDHWNITGDQLLFLESTLQKADQHTNIFVFSHQVIWWDDRAEFEKLRPNSLQGRGESVNFWPQVAPMFKNIPNPIYLFAGDTGAFPRHLPFYFQDHNMHFIASGMGGGKNDNFLIVNRRANPGGEVEIELKWLQREPPIIFTPTATLP
jgi:hypothetical protein